MYIVTIPLFVYLYKIKLIYPEMVNKMAKCIKTSCIPDRSCKLYNIQAIESVRTKFIIPFVQTSSVYYETALGHFCNKIT